jgi:hypothetical protein
MSRPMIWLGLFCLTFFVGWLIYAATVEYLLS